MKNLWIHIATSSSFILSLFRVDNDDDIVFLSVIINVDDDNPKKRKE